MLTEIRFSQRLQQVPKQTNKEQSVARTSYMFFCYTVFLEIMVRKYLILHDDMDNGALPGRTGHDMISRSGELAGWRHQEHRQPTNATCRTSADEPPTA